MFLLKKRPESNRMGTAAGHIKNNVYLTADLARVFIPSACSRFALLPLMFSIYPVFPCSLFVGPSVLLNRPLLTLNGGRAFVFSDLLQASLATRDKPPPNPSRKWIRRIGSLEWMKWIRKNWMIQWVRKMQCIECIRWVRKNEME